MDALYLTKGIVIGFSIAAPVGPIGLLCIRRSISHGALSGLLTGLGAATADACYGCIAGFGLTVITSLLIHQKVWLQLVGGLFLCYLGIATFLKGRSETLPVSEGRGYLLSYVSAFFLTLTNPMTILSFAAIFAGIGIATATNGYVSAITLVAGVFMGSALWWAVLTGSLKFICRTITPAIHRWVNRLSGGVLLLFGVGSLVNVIM
jgi:threonine/homoserine/homoserine lactone efflux protein